jgi:hypothetical protein
MSELALIDEAAQLRLERELAEALGWTSIELGGVFDDDLFGIAPGSQRRGRIEPWTREWFGCAEIMTEHSAFPKADFAAGQPVGVTVFAGEPFQASVLYGACEDKATAVRCAVVEGITKKLLHEKGDGGAAGPGHAGAQAATASPVS